MIHFDLPKDKSSIIKVIGVGGGGSNAVNHMFSQGIDGVNFIICNTDAQAIAQSKVPNKVQLGPHLTQGLGAGADPSVGRQATEESLEEIKKILEVNTKMVFVTAGMGGGTGPGGAPIVSKICKEMGILTVGIVTTPFGYEGKKRMLQAEEGINQLKEQVDTLLIINNDKLRHQFGNLKMSEAFAKADNILATATKCITDVIGSTGQINVDFADVCTVMRNGGVAILGNAAMGGDNRAQTAIEDALNSPLLNDNDIRGAKWILVNINSSRGEYEHTMDEVDIIQNYIMEHAGDDTDVILGLGFDESLADKISITLIATGFDQKNPFKPTAVIETVQPKEEKIVMTLGVLGDEIKMENGYVPAEQLVTIPTPIQDAMAPQLVEPISTRPSIITFEPVQVIPTIVAEPTTELPQHYVLQTTETVIDTTFVSPEPVVVATTNFLAKPTNIYDPTVIVPVVNTIQPNTTNTVELTIDHKLVTNSEVAATENIEMELVIKEEMPITIAPVQTEMNLQQAAPINAFEPPTPLPEEEDSLSKAAERTKKLRNLSFNFNANDAEEFENEPAYLRRKNEIHNTLANVEKFYSNYTVGVDDNNVAKINENSKNSFLEGEKPD